MDAHVVKGVGSFGLRLKGEQAINPAKTKIRAFNIMRVVYLKVCTFFEEINKKVYVFRPKWTNFYNLSLRPYAGPGLCFSC